MLKNMDLSSSIFLMVVGLAFLWGGVQLGMGHLHEPGPGFFPLLMGGVVVALSVLQCLESSSGRAASSKADGFWKEKDSWKRVTSSLFSLVFYLLFLDPLGYVVTTFPFLLYLIKFTGKRGWPSSLLVAALASLVSYLLFKVGMEVPLPKGILKIG
jgi:putative tricarboxylic transport membrane protein